MYMPYAKYKQKCTRCRKNYVIVTARNRFPLCYDCQKPELQGVIKDENIRKLLDIPEEYYRTNAFLRNIKISYLKFGQLTDIQKDAFKKAVQKMKEGE